MKTAARRDDPSDPTRYAQRLRRLAELWPTLDERDRAQLEPHVHSLRQKVAALSG